MAWKLFEPLCSYTYMYIVHQKIGCEMVDHNIKHKGHWIYHMDLVLINQFYITDTNTY